MRHGCSVILFCIRRSGVLSSAALLFWAVSSPFFWLISAKTAAKAAYPVSCPMLCRERGDPLRGTGRAEPDPRCPAARPRGGCREAGGQQPRVSGHRGVPMAFLMIPQHGPEQPVAQAARPVSAGSSAGASAAPRSGSARGGTLKIRGGEVLSRGWRRQGYFPPPPPSPAAYLGGGTGHHALEGAAAVG